jgi:hypothetical protein
VAVPVVVPGHQVSHPLAGRREIGKGFQRIRRAVLQGFEQRFRVGVCRSCG